MRGREDLLALLEGTLDRGERARWALEDEARLDEFRQWGRGGALAALGAADSIVPGSPATLRGKIGAWVIGLQAGLLWWVLRAFGLRDAALREVAEEGARQRVRIRELESRLERLEERQWRCG